ncbi:MAG: hypothetical protein JG775_1053 [Defluviitaleaceae bacterium]|nr:hypothetical protein [Defluviitaleaceae bacterium]
MAKTRYRLVPVEKDIDVNKQDLLDIDVNQLKNNNKQIDIEEEYEADETSQGNKQYNKQINYNLMKQYSKINSEADAESDSEADAKQSQKSDASAKQAQKADADAKQSQKVDTDAIAYSEAIAAALSEISIALNKINAFLSSIEVDKE